MLLFVSLRNYSKAYYLKNNNRDDLSRDVTENPTDKYLQRNT